MDDIRTSTRERAVPLALALAALALQLATVNAYGWFRDELYYVACGEHLDWGYVDHPPLIALITRFAREVFGDSLWAVRLLPALAGAAVVLLAARLARELGGGALAQAVAALCAALAPIYLSIFHILSMNAFEILLWTLGALVLARIVHTGDGRLWLLFGLVAGIGLETKHSMLVFGFAAFVALALTPERRHFARPWIWLGGLLAFLLFLPNLIWQQLHGWPTLEFMDNAQRLKNVAFSPLAFFREQILMLNPLSVPVWLGGLGWLLFAKRGRPFRLFGWMYLVALAVLLTQRSKPYYLGPIYPLLFAAGGAAWESCLARLQAPRLRIAVATALVLLVAAGGLLALPMALPVLPEKSFIHYSRALGIQPGTDEKHEMGDLPQFYADMHGWREMAAEVARVYRSLPPEEQKVAEVFGQNYGEAGAINVLGRDYGLPRAISGHNSFWLWGPEGYDGRVLIILGGDEDDNRRVCPDLRRAGTVRCRYCMPYEDGLPVWLCHNLTPPFPELWPELKKYI
jgi:4-amino-4-deoxy-L-arabinose transferase-like glycosyltransferase